MSASTELFGTYEAWREWSEAEGDAIRQLDLPLVAHCQQAKQMLQARIINLTQEAQAEWTRVGRDVAEAQREIRAVIQELILIETRNGEDLAEQRHNARAQCATLDQSTRNLRRVRESYAPVAAPAWNSYSR